LEELRIKKRRALRKEGFYFVFREHFFPFFIFPLGWPGFTWQGKPGEGSPFGKGYLVKMWDHWEYYFQFPGCIFWTQLIIVGGFQV